MKKKITSLIVCAVMLMTVFPAANLSISAADADPNFLGSGTAADPFQIKTAYDLKHFAELMNNSDFYGDYYNKYFIQTADIDLGNEPFTPIGTWESYIYAFAGEYNGNYHSIINLNVDHSGGFVGLFGRIGLGNEKHTDYCSVKNLSVYGNIKSESQSLVGGIVGEIGYGASIQNCSFTGTVKAENAARVGGIAGQIFCGGTIESCYVNADISCKTTSGGITGGLDIGANKNTGSTDAVVRNSYFYGSVSGDQTGGIAGRTKIGTENEACSVVTENNYYIDTITGAIDGKSFEGCYKLSSKLLKETAELLGTPFVANNRNDDFNNGYPIFEWQIIPYQFKGNGTKDDPYQISSKEELEEMRDLVNNQFFTNDYKGKCYIQTADIDLKNEPWTPIAPRMINNKDLSAPIFYGSYNGNHHIIKNLNVNETNGNNYSGLFGSFRGDGGGVIENLIVYGTVKSNGSCVGGIAGEIVNGGGTIRQCAFIGDVSGKNGVGGISGVIYSFGTIEGCYHQGNVSTISETGKDIGGIVGWLQAGFSENAKGNAVVKSCYNIGSVSGTEKYSSIVGEVFDGDDHDGNVIVENCYSIKGEAPATTNGECTTYDVTTLSESMLKKAASELGSAFTTAPSNDANNGYPVFKWQSYTPLLNWLLGNPDTIITESNWKDFDLNNDGKLNAIDLTLMKRNLLKAGT